MSMPIYARVQGGMHTVCAVGGGEGGGVDPSSKLVYVCVGCMLYTSTSAS